MATSLTGYSYTPPSGTITPANNGIIHVEIVNARLNDNRQKFLFNLRTTTSQTNSVNVLFRVRKITLTYIAIGDLFDGFYSNLPSSYIFARNSGMVRPNLLSGQRTNVDFASPTSLSPFLYTPGNSSLGCGAVKRNSNWVIENNCTDIKATIFITGFDLNVPLIPGTQRQQAEIFQNNIQVDLKSATDAIYSSDPNR